MIHCRSGEEAKEKKTVLLNRPSPFLNSIILKISLRDFAREDWGRVRFGLVGFVEKHSLVPNTFRC